ncbi:hypothetical protein SeMB42_g05964 [Synchytrium endobioticum]|uniref:Uncharacterized protein n=1 Tax=Synchytrium endobioticum TaxID=286115 RepID=A0A507CN06_9FUNG|nr:hypothetical protein SeMB42_g05964 [Synchytrium endobioticum]TPX44460.1 hypothetical protein SeLEV6574_g04482 [Synchytrium endobioticum]
MATFGTTIVTTATYMLGVGFGQRQAVYLDLNQTNPIFTVKTGLPSLPYEKYFSCVNFSNDVYCISDSMKSLYKFDQATMSLQPSQILDTDPLPSYGTVSLVVLGNTVYMYGGLDQPLLSTINVDTGMITRITPTNMPPPRTGFSIAAISPHEFLVMYGHDINGIPTDTIYKYNDQSNAFTNVTTTGTPPMSGVNYPVCTYPNQLVTVTGDLAGITQVYTLNTMTNAWTSFPKPLGGSYAPLGGERVGLACFNGVQHPDEHFLGLVFDPVAIYALDMQKGQFIGNTVGMTNSTADQGVPPPPPPPSGGVPTPPPPPPPPGVPSPPPGVVVASPTAFGSAFPSATPMFPMASASTASMAPGSLPMESPTIDPFPMSSPNPNSFPSQSVVPTAAIVSSGVPKTIIISISAFAGMIALLAVFLFVMDLQRRRARRPPRNVESEVWAGMPAPPLATAAPTSYSGGPGASGSSGHESTLEDYLKVMQQRADAAKYRNSGH